LRSRECAEPGRLDGVYAAGALAFEEAPDVGVRRPGVRPEGAARALAREPVEREVAGVDRPDEALVLGVALAVVRLEPRDPGVLADVPERMRPLARVRRR